MSSNLLFNYEYHYVSLFSFSFFFFPSSSKPSFRYIQTQIETPTQTQSQIQSKIHTQAMRTEMQQCFFIVVVVMVIFVVLYGSPQSQNVKEKRLNSKIIHIIRHTENDLYYNSMNSIDDVTDHRGTENADGSYEVSLQGISSSVITSTRPTKYARSNTSTPQKINSLKKTLYNRGYESTDAPLSTALKSASLSSTLSSTVSSSTLLILTKSSTQLTSLNLSWSSTSSSSSTSLASSSPSSSMNLTISVSSINLNPALRQNVSHQRTDQQQKTHMVNDISQVLFNKSMSHYLKFVHAQQVNSNTNDDKSTNYIINNISNNTSNNNSNSSNSINTNNVNNKNNMRDNTNKNGDNDNGRSSDSQPANQYTKQLYQNLIRYGFGLDTFTADEGGTTWVENGMVYRPWNQKISRNLHPGAFEPEYGVHIPFDEKIFFEGRTPPPEYTNEPKIILWYTKPRYAKTQPGLELLRNCPDFPCQLTTNRKLANRSSAMLFAGNTIH